MSKRVVIVALCGVLSACVAPPQPAAVNPPRKIACKAGADCDAKWSRAVAWVVRNSDYKIQTQTDMLIQTMGPIRDDPSPAFTVTKAIQSPGIYEITFNGGCRNSNVFVGCIPTMDDARSQFEAFVLGK